MKLVIFQHHMCGVILRRPSWKLNQGFRCLAGGKQPLLLVMVYLFKTSFSILMERGFSISHLVLQWRKFS
uniref:Dolichyl-diphosphooligosaccharide--protein glycosyltransferase 67 kDasubunit n=1 Tax=Arundo donax TaxID=35708 RepID=A0A0A9CI00_ARUDO